MAVARIQQTLDLPRLVAMFPVIRLLALAFASFVLAPTSVLYSQSYTPEHPKVQAMVDRGVSFLQSGSGRRLGGSWQDGETILVGYTLLKATGDTAGPKVQQAIQAATQLANSVGRRNEGGDSKVVYEASLAAVFLASLDAGKYRSQLQQILGWMQTVQKPHGGWGYPDRTTGDTSQVQYAMLALWTMNEVGMDVPAPMVEATIRYLRATLDPSGGWGYQGVLSTGNQLVAQVGVTKSLSTAGLGSLIIGGDILKLFGQRKTKNAEEEGIPDAFVRVDLRKKLRAEKREITMTRSDIDGPISLGRRYQNATKFTGTMWYYYWMYSQERYESFAEIVDNKQNKSPDWYNTGVEQLAKLQAADGSWGGENGADVTSAEISSSFAILFLIRSTQKAIGKLDEGVTFGGYGLPKDVSSIKMVGDRIVSDAETSVENLLLMLEKDEVSEIQIGLLPDNLQLNQDPGQRREQVARLSRLLVSGDYNARRLAAKLLGRSEDLSQVPSLIYALTDDDPYVPMIAEESLRLLSRKLTAGNLGAQPTLPERQAAEKYWKTWYLGLRPDYIFVDR